MSTNIIRRRVQKLGGSSLVITLPKSWVRKTGITVGENVIIVDEGEYLKVYPSRLVSGKPLRSVYIDNSTGIMNKVSIERVAECAYLNGYGKIVIENLRGSAAKVLEEASHSPRVKQAVVNEGRVEIELAEQASESSEALVTILKSYMQSLHRILDYIEEAGKYGDIREDLDSVVEASVDSATRLARHVASREGECSSGLLLAASLMIEVPRILGHVAPLAIDKWNDEVADLISSIRWGLVEVLGGLSSGSVKRLEEANKKAKELRLQARRLSQPELSGLRVAAEIIADIINLIATFSLCKVLEEYSR